MTEKDITLQKLSKVQPFHFQQFQRSDTHSRLDTENRILENHVHMEINFEDLAELQEDVLDSKDKVSDNFVSANDSGIDLKVQTLLIMLNFY